MVCLRPFLWPDSIWSSVEYRSIPFLKGFSRASIRWMRNGSTLLFCYLQVWSRCNRQYDTAMETKQLRDFLNGSFDRILLSLPMQFTSQQFIQSFKDRFPDRFAEVLDDAGNHRQLHSWIARWYLNGQAKDDRIDKLDVVQVVSIMGNKTKNRRWGKK